MPTDVVVWAAGSTKRGGGVKPDGASVLVGEAALGPFGAVVSGRGAGPAAGVADVVAAAVADAVGGTDATVLSVGHRGAPSRRAAMEGKRGQPGLVPDALRALLRAASGQRRARQPVPRPGTRLGAAVEPLLLEQLWAAIHSRRTLFGRTVENARDFFDAADRDGKGSISPADLRRAMHRLDVGLSSTQISRLLATVDTSRSGAIEEDEFGRWMARGRPGSGGASDGLEAQLKLQWFAVDGDEISDLLSGESGLGLGRRVQGGPVRVEGLSYVEPCSLAELEELDEVRRSVTANLPPSTHVVVTASATIVDVATAAAAGGEPVETGRLALVALGECPDGGRFMVPHRGTDVSRGISPCPNGLDADASLLLQAPWLTSLQQMLRTAPTSPSAAQRPAGAGLAATRRAWRAAASAAEAPLATSVISSLLEDAVLGKERCVVVAHIGLGQGVEEVVDTLQLGLRLQSSPSHRKKTRMPIANGGGLRPKWAREARKSGKVQRTLAESSEESDEDAEKQNLREARRRSPPRIAGVKSQTARQNADARAAARVRREIPLPDVGKSRRRAPYKPLHAGTKPRPRSAPRERTRAAARGESQDARAPAGASWDRRAAAQALLDSQMEQQFLDSQDEIDTIYSPTPGDGSIAGLQADAERAARAESQVLRLRKELAAALKRCANSERAHQALDSSLHRVQGQVTELSRERQSLRLELRRLNNRHVALTTAHAKLQADVEHSAKAAPSNAEVSAHPKGQRAVKRVVANRHARKIPEAEADGEAGMGAAEEQLCRQRLAQATRTITRLKGILAQQSASQTALATSLEELAAENMELRAAKGSEDAHAARPMQPEPPTTTRQLRFARQAEEGGPEEGAALGVSQYGSSSEEEGFEESGSDGSGDFVC